MRKANRIANVPPYLFAEIEKKRDELAAKGKDIIYLSIGDPDLPTPKRILKAFHKAVDDAKNHNYPPYEGTKEFRSAVAACGSPGPADPARPLVCSLLHLSWARVAR